MTNGKGVDSELATPIGSLWNVSPPTRFETDQPSLVRDSVAVLLRSKSDFDVTPDLCQILPDRVPHVATSFFTRIRCVFGFAVG